MVKIGILGGRLGETNPSTPYKKWMDNVPDKYIDADGWILNEAALVAAIEYKYPDAEVKYITNLNEKTLQKNDVNFLVGVNLLNAWHGKSKVQYQKWLAIMKNKKNNIYPPLSEQNFLYNKGDYLKYYENKGIPIAPTFLIKKKRDASDIIKKVRENGWSSFIVKPDYAFANIEISKYDLKTTENTQITESYYSDDPSITEKTESFYSDIPNSDDGKVEKELTKYLQKTKKFPGLVCQEKMIGFAKKFEVKTYWLNGEYKYNVSIKAWPPPESFGNVSKGTLKGIQKLAQKVLDNYPETKIKGKVVRPLFLRIDLGCCQGNTLDTTKYFLNEIEYAGCGTFTDVKNVFHYWPEAYYKKAIEISNL